MHKAIAPDQENPLGPCTFECELPIGTWAANGIMASGA